MNCHEVEDLIHAHLDGELDLVRSLEVEQHLAHCKTCSAAHARHLTLRTAVRQHASHPAPATLRASLAAAIRSEPEPETPAAPARFRITRYIPRLAAAAAIVVVGMLTWLVLQQPSAAKLLTEEIVSDHIRSLQAEHLTDVTTSDQHTVKPWFSGKLDFSPHVQDLATDGFPLVGGRLDYLGGKNVAALVYRRNRHLINVFVWPAAPDAPVTPMKEELRGFHLVRFTAGGLLYCAVSDVDPIELDRIAHLLQQPTTQSSAAEPN